MELARGVIYSENSTWDEIAIFDRFNECSKYVVIDGVFGNWSSRSLECLEKEQRLQSVAVRVSSQLQSIGEVQEQELMDETLEAMAKLAQSDLCDRFDWQNSASANCGTKGATRVDAYEMIKKVIPKWYALTTSG
jgi:hypothetical protein